MPIAKPSTVVALDSMKSVDVNDSVDTFIRQMSAKEPLLPFSRTGDSPGQWFQLLNVLDQPELPGWPLLTPMKFQMQKCEKCPQEFCAPINYRRHIRVHRRSLKVDKNSRRIRDMLAAFWDKLSLEESKEVVSFKDVSLKEISGSSVIKAWATSIRKPLVWTLPQDYVRSGSMLLDIIHANPSRLPISSRELFCILDDASERTFLCAGTAESIQKYVFDGEVAKIALELKNLVACISFLFEQKLLKAWLADKDAESLRCQKLLVEEEEAAQKRQAELLERKKQRKLRQKEQKARERSNGEKTILDVTVNSLQELPVVETSSHSALSDSNFDASDTLADVFSSEELVNFSNSENCVDSEARISQGEHSDLSTVPNSEAPTDSSSIRQWWRVPKSQRNKINGFHEGHNVQLVQLEPLQKHIPLRDRGTSQCNSKVWTKKFRTDKDDNSSRCRSEEVVSQPDEDKCELIIGSISVSVPAKNIHLWKKDLDVKDAGSTNSSEQGIVKQSNDVKEHANSHDLHASGSRIFFKQWRPLSVKETTFQLPYQNVQDLADEIVPEKLAGQDASDGFCQQSVTSDENHRQSPSEDSLNHKESIDCSPSLSQVAAVREEPDAVTPGLEFPSVAARAFLAERWKDAISAEHVKLVLSPEPATSGASFQPIVTSGSSYGRANIRTNPEKGEKRKYIRKQKVAA